MPGDKIMLPRARALVRSILEASAGMLSPHLSALTIFLLSAVPGASGRLNAGNNAINDQTTLRKLAAPEYRRVG